MGGRERGGIKGVREGVKQDDRYLCCIRYSGRKEDHHQLPSISLRPFLLKIKPTLYPVPCTVYF